MHVAMACLFYILLLIKLVVDRFVWPFLRMQNFCRDPGAVGKAGPVCHMSGDLT